MATVVVLSHMSFGPCDSRELVLCLKTNNLNPLSKLSKSLSKLYPLSGRSMGPPSGSDAGIIPPADVSGWCLQVKLWRC